MIYERIKELPREDLERILDGFLGFVLYMDIHEDLNANKVKLIISRAYEHKQKDM